MPRNKRQSNAKKGSQHNEKLIDDDIFNIMDSNPINNSNDYLNNNQLNTDSDKNNSTSKGVVPIVEDVSPKRAGRFEKRKQKENILRRTLTATPPKNAERTQNVKKDTPNPIKEDISTQENQKDIAEILNEFPEKASSTIEFEKPHSSEKVVVAETPSYTLYEELEIDPLEELEEPAYKVFDEDNNITDIPPDKPDTAENSPPSGIIKETQKSSVVLSEISIDNMDIAIPETIEKPKKKFSVHIGDNPVPEEKQPIIEEKSQRVSITQTLQEAKAIPSYTEGISQDDVLKVLLENDDIPSTENLELNNLAEKGIQEDLSLDKQLIEKQKPIAKGYKKTKENEPLADPQILDKIDIAQKELNIKPKRKQKGISLKSTPDVDFLEINQEETENSDETADNTKKSKKKGFDDFQNKKDANALFNDLLDLRGSIVFRVALLIILTLISGYISLANNYNLPTIDILKSDVSTSSFVFIQIIIGLLAMISSLNIIVSGVKKFFKMKADSDSLAAMSFTITFIASLLSLSAIEMVGRGIIHIYIPIAIASLLFNAIGKLITVDRAINNFEVVSSNIEHYAIMYVENEELAERITRGTFVDYPILAKMKKTDFLIGFLKYTYSYDIADKYCKIAAPAIVGVSLVFAGISAVLFRNSFIGYEWQTGLSFFSLFMSACACMGITLLVNIPLLKASEKYPPMMGALLGYQSVDDFYDVNSIMIDAETLFPRGTVRLSAIKTFSDTKIDDAIIDAASLTEYAGSIMRYMFNDVIMGNTAMLRPVENYVYEDSTGICGWINNKRVLLGNRELMVAHSIEGIPTKTKEFEFTGETKEAVYLSISGNLSAMFIVDMKANFYVKQSLEEIEKNNISVMIKSIDSIVTVSKMSQLFNIPEEMIKIIPNKLHSEYKAETEFVSKQSASMACGNDFVTASQLLISTKRIRKTAIMGLVLQSTGALLGILIALVFILLKSFDQLTTSMLLIYNLAWTILTVVTAYLRKE